MAAAAPCRSSIRAITSRSALNIVLYAALCTAWTLFSGPTHYVSLATAAFFGLGTYAVGLGLDHLPFPVLVLAGGAVAAVLAGLVGAATLRISGVYFVIFTFGLAELVRQVVSYAQIKLSPLAWASMSSPISPRSTSTGCCSR